MSKRTDKKKQKRVQEAIATAPTVTNNTDIFIQYQNHEYLEKDIISKIEAKCKSEGQEVTGEMKLCVYIKPEDQKAYYTYGDLSGFVEL